MKVFHHEKYEYIGLQSVGRVLYYAFRCLKKDFSPEIVLVREARMTFPSSSVFYDESELLDLEGFENVLFDSQE